MTDMQQAMASYRRFRLQAVRLALFIAGAVAAATWYFDRLAAQGFLLGGVAGVAGFWIMAIRLEKLATVHPEKVKIAALTWTYYRFVLYSAALYWAYTLDREDLHAFVGAIAGIFVIRFVALYLGIRGAGAKPDTSRE